MKVRTEWELTSDDQADLHLKSALSEHSVRFVCKQRKAKFTVAEATPRYLSKWYDGPM